MWATFHRKFDKQLNSSSIDELGRWCLRVSGAGRCRAGKEVSMVTLERPPPSWAPSHWRTQWNTYQPTTRLFDQPKGGWARQKAKLASECGGEMSLRMIASSVQRCVQRSWKAPVRILGHPKLCASSGSGPLHMGVTKCPSEPPRLQASFLHPKAAGEHCFEVNFA